MAYLLPEIGGDEKVILSKDDEIATSLYLCINSLSRLQSITSS